MTESGKSLEEKQECDAKKHRWNAPTIEHASFEIDEDDEDQTYTFSGTPSDVSTELASDDDEEELKEVTVGEFLEDTSIKALLSSRSRQRKTRSMSELAKQAGRPDKKHDH